jgi:hypothetical protein
MTEVGQTQSRQSNELETERNIRASLDELHRTLAVESARYLLRYCRYGSSLTFFRLRLQVSHPLEAP